MEGNQSEEALGGELTALQSQVCSLELELGFPVLPQTHVNSKRTIFSDDLPGRC